jgi:trehalose 6-phosphate phosphatase
MSSPERPAPARFRSPRRAPPALDPECALFLDIDGTLLEYATRPDEVRVDAELIRALPSVAAHLDNALALITGRSITGVDRLFPTLRLAVAGQHGSERRAADGTIHRHSPDPEIFSRLQQSLETLAQRHPGLLLENKGSTLALHYREAPQLAAHVHRVLRAIVPSLGNGSFDLQPGERMLEVRQRGLHKGTAIGEFMREPPFAGRRPVFVGDDKADEYGFEVIDRQGGWSIKVGRGKSGARYRLKDTAAVRQWLLSLVLRNP